MKTIKTYEIICNAEKRNEISEREINLLKLRLNRGDWDADFCGSIPVSEEQSAKGKTWILKRLAKSNGKPRKGFESCAELINLAKDEDSVFTFEGFANISRYSYFAAPIYKLSNGCKSISYNCTGQGVITVY